ncbi:MAG: M28 family peptidase, partial [Chloroflexota bacterium]
MGGALMTLGELGFLGVFIGGGLGASGEYGLPTVIYYDIPEWSVMLANGWRSFRSYPWSTVYPSLAFFLAILGFTFLGEGVCWLTERLTLGFRALFNRYTVAASLVVALGANLAFASSSFYTVYAPWAQSFNGARALASVQHLANESYDGRRADTADAARAAEWIAAQFESLGLQPAGQNELGYYQDYVTRYRVPTEVPTCVLRSPGGQAITLTHGVDFVESIGPYSTGGWGAGEVVVVTSGSRDVWSIGQLAIKYNIGPGEVERRERIALELAPGAFEDALGLPSAGVLTLDDAGVSDYRFEMLARERTAGPAGPTLRLRRAWAERLLADTGRSLDELLALTHDGVEAFYVPTGWRAELHMPSEVRTDVVARNVLAFWPGRDMVLDAEAIVVSAHYDGLGRRPDGTLHPGANDNASGVAVMLEAIRVLKAQCFAPKRTLILVAWTGGEFHEPPDYVNWLGARLGFAEAYTVVAALDMQGLGAGTGHHLVAWRATSERLSQVVARAAHKVGTPHTSLGPGLHADPALWPAPPRGIPAVTLSWAGSDNLAHRPTDRAEAVDLDKLAQAGRTLALTLMVLASDPAY